MATQREQSKKEWESRDTAEDLKIGCLQRIADASELMAKNHIKLQYDLDCYKKWYIERGDTIQKRNKTISSLKGQITKLKKKNNANP